MSAIAKNDYVENVEHLPTPDRVKDALALAAQITKCQSWLAVLELIDNASVSFSKKSGTILRTLLNKYFNQGERQHLLNLLNAHVAQFPEDERAVKAQAIANSHSQQGEKLEK